MKWFKHMTATADDEKIAALIGAGGKDGLARLAAYWRLCEIVAAQMEVPAPSCSVSYPVSHWAQKLFVRKSYLCSILLRLKNVGLLDIEGDVNKDSVVTVRIPNLLKCLDEYTQKSGHTPENVGPRTEEELEQRQMKKKGEGKAPSFPLGPTPISTPTQAEANGELSAAAKLWQELGLAASRSDVELLAEVLTFERARNSGGNAYVYLLQAAQTAIKRGEVVNVFWFKDRKFAKQDKYEKYLASADIA
jgi:hypothetical protein